MKRKALGKGLNALLPEPEPEASGRGALEVPVQALEPNPFQPRTRMQPARMEELTASIRESGLVQPILARSLPGGRYQIIAGERRWRAAQKAGLATVPVALREVPEEKLLELALVENIQREELTPLEEAQAFHRLQEELHLTQEEVARRIGRERSTVANTLRLLRLPAKVQELLADGRVDAGHARALLALDRAEQQIELRGGGRSPGPLGARGRASGGPAARPRPEARGPQGRQHTRRRGAAASRPGLPGGDPAARQGGFLRVAFTSEAELNRLFDLLLRASRSRPA